MRWGRSALPVGPDFVFQQLKETLWKEQRYQSYNFDSSSKGLSIRKIEDLQGASNYLASSNAKPGRSLDPEVACTVDKFCFNDSVSRVMPGCKTVWLLILGGTGEHKQAWLVLTRLYMLDLRSHTWSQGWVLEIHISVPCKLCGSWSNCSS